MKKVSKYRKDVKALLVATISLVVLLSVFANLNKNAKKDINFVEITSSAQSPAGFIGGSALPASCESGVWNNNNGYHLDGVTSDPGNCGAAPATPVDGKCGSADGLETDTAPGSNLCENGAASAVSGNGPWSWTCDGSNGGTNASCGAPKTNPVNNPPTTLVISGDQWAIVNQTTSNWIRSTDPENDDIFYELDWDCDGSIDGSTGSQASGFNTPIGHTYTSVGTKTVCGYAVQSNDTTKRSGQGRYTIRVTNGECTVAPNACGATNGTVVNGECVAPGLPAGYGDSCSSAANACGMTNNNGTINCSGQCVGASVPSNTLCGCTSAANVCGMTNTGNLNAAGVCTAITPPNTSCPCNSGENACGMTSTGNLNAAGVCTAATPNDNLCPAPGVGVAINSFTASPKLIAQGKTSRLYWDISGNRNGCRITYTTNTSNSVVVVTGQINTNVGQMDTTSVTEKRYYKLSCGATEQTAVVSVFSLTEI